MNHEKALVGWREWVSLPDLGIPRIKAKIDSGARSSALHAFHVDAYTENGVRGVHFFIHPRQTDDSVVTECKAQCVDYRWVCDSGGHKEKRYVINTQVSLGALTWEIEMTLTNRDSMKFRMLLGRTAMRGRLLVDPERSYLVGRPRGKK